MLTSQYFPQATGNHGSKTKKKGKKKENSPLPDDLAGCLVNFRGGAQLGTDPRSHNAAVLFWLTDGEAPSAGRGCGAGLRSF